MNLASNNFNKSPLLKHLPRFDSLVYKGETPSKIKLFEASTDGNSCQLASLTTIRKEEKLLWVSFKDLVDRTIKTAAPQVKGYFGFEIISFSLEDKIESFQWNHLIQLLINKSKEMKVGEEQLIQYSSLFAIFKKRVDETWGRIELLIDAEVFNKEPHQLDLLIKKVVKEMDPSTCKIVTISDLSYEPIMDFRNHEQRDRLKRFFEKQKEEGGAPLSAVYVLQRGKAIELLTKLELKAPSKTEIEPQ